MKFAFSWEICSCFHYILISFALHPEHFHIFLQLDDFPIFQCSMFDESVKPHAMPCSLISMTTKRFLFIDWKIFIDLLTRVFLTSRLLFSLRKVSEVENRKFISIILKINLNESLKCDYESLKSFLLCFHHLHFTPIVSK